MLRLDFSSASFRVLGAMSAKISETIVLRTYPLREADLIVSCFTRDLGKLRGVARRARKPGSRFGSGLERLSHIRLHYFFRENRELMSFDSCELIHSRFAATREYELTVGLDYIAELSEAILPPHEANERFFRLLVAVSTYLVESGGRGLWPAINYFTLWAVRLTGVLGPMELTEEDRAIGEEILRKPVAELAPREWSRQTGHKLRRGLIRMVEDHVERRLITAQYLEAL